MTPTTVPAAARDAARVLVELLARDQQLAIALNAASHRLHAVNARLSAGLCAEALLAIYGPIGPDRSLRGHNTPVLDNDHPIAALECVAHELRRAFSDYQQNADARRMLAADIGEATADLSAAMLAAGFTRTDARTADLHALTAGTWRHHESQ